MKNLILTFFFLMCFSSISAQTFEIKQITSGDFDVRIPVISAFSFWEMPIIYFELHKNDSSNIAVMGYDPNTNNFQNFLLLTTGNAKRINLYEDFNHNIAFQTNENGNWDIAFIPYSSGSWGSTILLTNSSADEFNLSPFYISDIGFPSNNFILFQRGDTLVVLEYDETVIAEYPVFVNTAQYQYSEYIGINYNYSQSNYPRRGIHIVAVETDSSGNRNLVYKYKPFTGTWEEKSFIKENCECRNPSLQKFLYTPSLIFEDSTSSGFRPVSVYDWEVEKNFEPIPDLLSGNISDFNVDAPSIITFNPSPDIELEFFPHAYLVDSDSSLKIRLNKLESGHIVGDTLIEVNANESRITLGELGFWEGAVFYTIWEDSLEDHVHLFGRRQLYPLSVVSDLMGINNYKLEQNYPNPFNPSTKIQYAIGSRQFVTIKVYDVLGNKIATLVNEEKPAGEYEVEFNPASSIEHPASGIYFYQLRAGEFIQTKKMIYLR
jgi:hypothetical protein